MKDLKSLGIIFIPCLARVSGVNIYTMAGKLVVEKNVVLALFSHCIYILIYVPQQNKAFRAGL